MAVGSDCSGVTDAQDLGPTARTQVRRNSTRGHYDHQTVHAILDSQRLCQVAYVENAEPRLIPTLYVRVEDRVYLHGNRQSALLKYLAGGGLCALSVICEDGIVVARSGFHCSMNYRSVVLFGQGSVGPADVAATVLDRFVDMLIPGHADQVRQPSPQELAATTVVCLPIGEASAKVRTGAPIDDVADLQADVWAGVIPLSEAIGTPQPAPDLVAGIAVPGYVSRYRSPS